MRPSGTAGRAEGRSEISGTLGALGTLGKIERIGGGGLRGAETGTQAMKDNIEVEERERGKAEAEAQSIGIVDRRDIEERDHETENEKDQGQSSTPPTTSTGAAETCTGANTVCVLLVLPVRLLQTRISAAVTAAAEVPSTFYIDYSRE